MKMNRMETTDKAMILAPFDESLQSQKRMEAAVELSQLVTEIVTYVICHTIVNNDDLFNNEFNERDQFLFYAMSHPNL